MQRVERRATVSATPEQVFAFLADLENLPVWQTGVLEAHRTSDGPMRVGATAHVTASPRTTRIEASRLDTEWFPPLG